MLQKIIDTIKLFGVGEKAAHLITIVPTIFLLGWGARGVVIGVNNYLSQQQAQTAEVKRNTEEQQVSNYLLTLSIGYTASLSRVQEANTNRLVEIVEQSGNKALVTRIKKEIAETNQTLPHYRIDKDTANVRIRVVPKPHLKDSLKK